MLNEDDAPRLIVGCGLHEPPTTEHVMEAF